MITRYSYSSNSIIGNRLTQNNLQALKTVITRLLNAITTHSTNEI